MEFRPMMRLGKMVLVRGAPVRRFSGLLSCLLKVVVVVAALVGLVSEASRAEAATAEGVCKPGVVRRDGTFVPVSWNSRQLPFTRAADAGDEVRLRYLGHSSFLITAPGGGRAVLDPYVQTVLNPVPDVVTVSNFHETHSQVGPYEGKTTILYGVLGDGRPNPVDRMFHGLRVAAFPQVSGDGQNASVVNTIFIFQAGRLCIAHFGNARFGPSASQFRELGKIHVLLLPIDGFSNIPHEVGARIVKRIGPNIVIPMHYWGPELPTRFAEALRAEGIERVSHPTSNELVLSLRQLPPPTTYMVLPNVEVP